MPKTKRDIFDALDTDFKDLVSNMNEDEIRDRIAKTALDQAALSEAKENDQDLAEKVEAAKVAGEVYREGSKANKLRIAYCRRVLGDRGKDTGDAGTES